MNILGIRELTIDILINDNNTESAIYGGGGTSHNIIWNLAQSNQNYNLYVGGITGNDYFSKKEIIILKKYNINTEFLEKKNKNTRKVFTFIEKNRETKNVTVCPICNKDVWSSSSTYKINYNLLKEKNINVVIFDSYKKENNEIAKYCIKNKILTIHLKHYPFFQLMYRVFNTSFHSLLGHWLIISKYCCSFCVKKLSISLTKSQCKS